VRRVLLVLVAVTGLMIPGHLASAETKVDNLSKVPGLTAEQKAAVNAYTAKKSVSEAAVSQKAASTRLAARGTRRAT
jgi:hypothetical protein